MAKVLNFPAPEHVATIDSPTKLTKAKANLTELRIEKLPVTGATYYVNDR